MRDAIALCYHAVSEDWTASLSVKPGALDEQVAHMLRRGYRAVTFTELVTAGGRGRRMAITFDDAFGSVLDLAFEVLARHGVPATVFVPTAFADADRLSWPGIDHWSGTHAHELRPLSWAQLRRLADAGWEIGSHTCSHPRLTCLDDAGLARELVDSRDAVAAEVGRCESFAYPYGDVDARVASAVRAVGYRTAVALDPRLWRSLEHLRPRIGVYRSDDRRRFALKTSPTLVRLRSTPAWALVEAARHARRGPETAALPVPTRPELRPER